MPYYTPEGGWARKPPAPLQEALDTLMVLADNYAKTEAHWRKLGSPPHDNWVPHRAEAYKTAFNVMRLAFEEEYAP